MFNRLVLSRSNESLAHCLNSFHELMDHGEVSWDILTHGFIKNVIITVTFYFLNPNLAIFAEILFYISGRHAGLRARTLDFQLNNYIQSLARVIGFCVLGQDTMSLHSLPLSPPSVQMDAGKFSSWGVTV